MKTQLSKITSLAKIHNELTEVELSAESCANCLAWPAQIVSPSMGMISVKRCPYTK